MGYATVEDLKSITVPTVDVVCGDLTYQLGALTRKQVIWIRDAVGYETDDDGNDLLDDDDNRVLKDAETGDLMMLACSLVQPDLDPENEDHLDLLRDHPMSYITDLVNEMMILSKLREEDPT